MEKRIGVILTGNAAGVIRSFSAGQAAAVQFARESESAMSRAASASKRYEASVLGTEAKVSASLASLKRTAGVALGGFSLMAGITAADDWGQYASRIRQATKSTEEYDHVQSRLVVSARNTFRALAETREGFIQTSPVLRDMGLSLDHSIDAIDTFSGLLVVNSASAEKGSSAMGAFSKSLNSGKTDADSWSSIMSAMPSIVDLLVVSTGRSAQEIRRLGVEGKLSVQEMVQALVSGNASVMQAVADMPTTVKDAVGQLGNAFGEYIGKANETRGVTAAMASSISYAAENFSLLADAAVISAGAGLVGYAAKNLIVIKGMNDARLSSVALAQANLAEATTTARKTAADVLAAQVKLASTKGSAGETAALSALRMAKLADVQATAAQTAAQTALNRSQSLVRTATSGVLGLLGGPGGLAVTAGLAATAWLTFSRSTEEAKASLADIESPLDSVVEKFEAINRSAQQNMIDSYLAKQAEAADGAEASWKRLYSVVRSVNEFGSEWDHSQWRDFRVELENAYRQGESLEPVLSKAVSAGVLKPDQISRMRALAEEVENFWQQEGKAGAAADSLTQRFKALWDAAGGAAGAVEELTTNAAGKTFLDRLVDTSITAGLKTQREQLEAMVKAGKYEFSPDDLKRARDAADVIDKANANKGGGGQARVSEGQRYIDQIKERIALLGKEGEYEKLQAQISVGAIKFKSLAQRQAAEEVAKAADKANASAKLAEMQREIDMTGLLSEADRMRYEVSRGAYVGQSADIKESLIFRASEIDATKRQTEQEKTLRDIQAERSLAERQFAREIEAFGRGDQYRGLMDSLSEIEERYQRIMDGLRNSPDGLSDGQRAMWESVRDAELESERGRYSKRLQLQEDWRLGATRALENYHDTARDVAGGVEDLFGNAFSGMEDALVSFARTGKLSFSDLVDSIISDLMRMIVQQSITGPLGSWLGSAFGSFFGGASTGLVSGASLPGIGGTAGGLLDGIMFYSGGYTGDGGRYDPAGVVHRGEGVLNQDEIRAIGGERGFNQLRRAIRGQGHALGGMAGSPGLPTRQGESSMPRVVINNNGTPQNYELQSWSQDEIALIAEDAATRVAPQVVARDMSRPNSRVWKSMNNSWKSEPRR